MDAHQPGSGSLWRLIHVRSNTPPAITTLAAFISSVHERSRNFQRVGIIDSKDQFGATVLPTSFDGGINLDCRHRLNQAETGK
jgi:hypothetical protein